MIKRNFQWTKCLVEIPLSKGVEHIIEVTMTLAKNTKFRISPFQRFLRSLVRFLLIVLPQHHFIEVLEAI